MSGGGVASGAVPGASSWGPGVRTSTSGEVHQLGVAQHLYAGGKRHIFLKELYSICQENCHNTLDPVSTSPYFHLPESCPDKYTCEIYPFKCNVLVQYITCVTVHGLELASWAQVKSRQAEKDLYKVLPHSVYENIDLLKLNTRHFRFAKGFWKKNLQMGVHVE